MRCFREGSYCQNDVSFHFIAFVSPTRVSSPLTVLSHLLLSQCLEEAPVHTQDSPLACIC